MPGLQGDTNSRRSEAEGVEITANTGAVNLDTFAGTTAHTDPGLTLGPSNPAISATINAWTVTDEGAVTGGNTVKLDQGGTFLNAGGVTVTGSLTAPSR